MSTNADLSAQNTAVFEHISGPFQGWESRVGTAATDISIIGDHRFSAVPAETTRDGKPSGAAVARLTSKAGKYHLEAAVGQDIWVNGRKFQAGELIDGDIVEFGEKGPLSRFRVAATGKTPRRRLGEICADGWDYLRSSRRPLGRRIAFAAGDSLRQFLTRTTLIFRVGVVFLFFVIGVIVYQQYVLNQMQQTELAESLLQIEKVAQALIDSQQVTITEGELAELRESITTRLAESDDRLAELERLNAAKITAIRDVAPSVVFLQGAYGLREPETNRILRHVIDDDGNKRMGPFGRPMVSLDGNGPPVERQFTGTGFAVADGTILATNRHVAVPWSGGEGAMFNNQAMDPYMIRFIAYLPQASAPVSVELFRKSEEVDLALVRMTDPSRGLPPLPIATDLPAQGESVTVLGYPTGLHSMVASAGKQFTEELRQSGQSGFWEVAMRLAEEQRIKPLSSYGIVAKQTDAFLVYDAATARGGSGGPVVNDRGEVVAVNAALLAQYDGSNFGVPAGKLLQLLELSQKKQTGSGRRG